MEKNTCKIKKISREKEDENWKFRSFLKNTSSNKLDIAVFKLYRKFLSEIDCKTCSNCCKELFPILDQKDIERLAGVLNLSSDRFKIKYLIKDNISEDYKFKSKPCPFPKDNLCLYYKERPKDCRSYPHLHKKGFASRLMDVIDNCSICPIVFNVYEELKKIPRANG